MKRRNFFGFLGAAGLGFATRPTSAAPPGTQASPNEPSGAADGIDPYFLDRGEIDSDEAQSIEAFEEYQEALADGRPAILPRGGRPKRAPTFRFLYLNGELGSPDSKLVGPLSIKPAFDMPGTTNVNAQILGFNCSTQDWSGTKGNGTLTIEMRGRLYGESMTWMFVEQFEVRKGGGTSVGLSYVAQRDGVPSPVVCEEPKLDMRIQLIRHRKAPGVLRNILKVGSFLTGAPMLGGGGSQQGSFDQSRPTLHVPQMLHEGVALAQATVGGMSDEAPIWRSGFNSYSLATGGGRMALRPGIWVAIDDSPDIDYGSLIVEDVGGRIGLRSGKKPLDVNYLVLSLEAGPA